MYYYTTKIRGSKLKNILDIPKEFYEKEVQVTVSSIEKNIINENSKIKELEDIFKMADKHKFKIPKNVNIDKLINKMYDDIL